MALVTRRAPLPQRPANMPLPIRQNASALKVPFFLGLGFVFLVTMAWKPLPTGIWHDDGVYLLISKSLAAGDGLTYAGVAGTPPAAKFPPLYSLILAPFWLLGGDLAAGSGWVAALNVLFMATAAAVACRFLIVRGGWSPAPAAAVAVVAWSSPVLWQLTAIPLSEPLFILGVCLCLPAFAAMSPIRGRPNPWPFVLAVAMVYLTRTAGVAALAAGVLALLLRREVRNAVLVALSGAAVVIPWTIWSGRATQQIAPPLRDILGSYGGWLGEQIMASPGAYLGVVTANLASLAAGLGDALAPFPSGPVGTLLSLVVAAAVVMGVRSAYRLSPLLVLFPLGYAAILSVWPYRSARLVAPLLPFLVLTAAAGVRDAVRRSGDGMRRWAVLAPTGAAAILLTLHSAWTLSTGRHLAPYEVRARTLVRAVEAVDGHAAPDAVLGAPELWAALHLHTGHTVVPSARFLPLAPGGATGGTPDQQIQLWTTAGIDHLLVEHGGRVHGDALTRLEESCSQGTVQVLSSFPGPGYLVRLDLARPCSALATADPEAL